MRLLIRATAGLILWAAAFSALYALHGIGCAAGWQGSGSGYWNLQRLLLTTAWLAALLVAALLAWRLRSDGHGVLPRVSAVLGWVGAIGTATLGLPILLTPTCV